MTLDHEAIDGRYDVHHPKLLCTSFWDVCSAICCKTMPMEGFKHTVPSRRSSRWCHRDDGLKPGKGHGDKACVTKCWIHVSES